MLPTPLPANASSVLIHSEIRRSLAADRRRRGTAPPAVVSGGWGRRPDRRGRTRRRGPVGTVVAAERSKARGARPSDDASKETDSRLATDRLLSPSLSVLCGVTGSDVTRDAPPPARVYQEGGVAVGTLVAAAAVGEETLWGANVTNVWPQDTVSTLRSGLERSIDLDGASAPTGLISQSVLGKHESSFFAVLIQCM